MCIFYLIRSFVIFYLFFGKKINTFSLKIYTFLFLKNGGNKNPPPNKGGGLSPLYIFIHEYIQPYVYVCIKDYALVSTSF